jgi:SET domain
MARMDGYAQDDTTAFVREVMLPGGPWHEPRIEPSACAFHLRAGRSSIHRWGIYAAEDIPARRRVIEYTGQRITLREGWRRRLRPQLYLFRCSARRLIDGGIGGSGAEFINHGCEPNLVARFDHRWTTRCAATSTRFPADAVRPVAAASSTHPTRPEPRFRFRHGARIIGGFPIRCGAWRLPGMTTS